MKNYVEFRVPRTGPSAHQRIFVEIGDAGVAVPADAVAFRFVEGEVNGNRIVGDYREVTPLTYFGRILNSKETRAAIRATANPLHKIALYLQLEKYERNAAIRAEANPPNKFFLYYQLYKYGPKIGRFIGIEEGSRMKLIPYRDDLKVAERPRRVFWPQQMAAAAA